MNRDDARLRRLDKVVATVRRRWRTRRFLSGASFALLAAAGVALLAALIMDAMLFEPTVVSATRWLSYAAIAVALALLVVMPLTTRAPDVRVALYVEESEPSLGMALASAVELSRARDESISPGLTEGVVDHALHACGEIEDGRRVERRRLRRAAGRLAAVAAALAVLLLLLPENLRHGLGLLLPQSTRAAINPYRVTVEPGDVLVERGAGQLVSARIEGFEPGEVTLYSRFGEESEWRPEKMAHGADGAVFERYLFDLEHDGEYYVQADSLRSPSFRIEVAELPDVERIDLVYHYPPRVGLQPRLERDTGDIRALPGTRVDLTVVPSAPVGRAELVLNGGQRVPLEPDDEGQWRASLDVDSEGYYYVALGSEEGRLLRGSADYRIELLADRAPTARIVRPGRDVQVTNVEEPLIEVRASDDLGVRSVDLVVSVNGGAEQRVSLHHAGERRSEVELSHTLFLEQLGLTPGDLIAYYARAGDGADNDVERAVTDMFFMEVRPFTQSFRQGQGQGGGGGMMSGADQGSLSAQQRDLVVATFNLSRDRDDYTEERFAETASTLARAQSRIRDRVVAIVRRLGARTIMRENQEIKSMVEELPKAVEAMREAESALSDLEPDVALAPARKALQHLQRAEAAFRDVRLSFGRGGGQGSSFTNTEDLANLFKLEMDKLRNQYEGVQRGQWQSPQATIDETLRKLKELARRQQRELDRMQRRAEQGVAGRGDSAAGSRGGSGSAGQRALAEALEQMARRLERLTREQPDEETRAMAEQLRNAADAMRRAASGEDGSGLEQARAAMERLRDAERLGESRGRAAIERRAHEAAARAERLLEQEGHVSAGMRGLPDDASARSDLVPRLRERKHRMETEARELEADIESLARQAREQDHDAARELDDAARAAREARVPEKIARSARALGESGREQLLRGEESITRALERMRDGIARGAEAAGGEGGDRLAANMERMRGMLRDLESLHERTRRSADNARGGDNAESQPGSGEQPGTSPGASSGAADGNADGRRAGAPGPGGAIGRPRGSRWGQGPMIPEGGVIDGQLGGGNVAELHREFIARRDAIGGLVRELDRQAHGARDIGSLLEELDALGREELARDPRELLERQAALLAALKRLEYELGKSALEDSPNERRDLRVTGNESVPAEYRSLVDEYFRDLSRSDTAAR